ncbi:MAG: type II toxin-antitoxin system VapC family toxin [Caldilineaceae bacterium]
MVTIGHPLRTKILEHREAGDTFAVDGRDADFAVDLQLSLRKIGLQLASFDALIAAVALRHKLTLLTTDKDFQAIEGLLTENWLVGLS